MGAYTSCTIYCDNPNRRPNGTDGPYSFECREEVGGLEAVNHCMTKMTLLCTRRADRGKFGQTDLQEETLQCPSRGMTEHMFVFIFYAIFMLTILGMGACQYTVGWAVMKQRKIYLKLEAFTGLGVWRRRPLPRELLPRGEDVDSEDVRRAYERMYEEDDNANILAEPIGPITTHSVQQVQIAALGGGSAKLQLMDFNNAAFDNLVMNGGPQDTESISSFRAQQLRRLNDLTDGLIPELVPLHRAAWLACWCQLSVLFAWFSVICMMLYVFLYYKPKVEMEAKGPTHSALFKLYDGK